MLKELLENVENQTFVAYKEDEKTFFLCYQDKEFIEVDETKDLKKRNPIRVAKFLEEIYDSDEVKVIGKGQYGEKLDLSPFYI